MSNRPVSKVQRPSYLNKRFPGRSRGKGGQHWSGGDWFAVPSSMVDDGTLNSLTRAELLTLLVMLRYAGFKTGETRPGADLIEQVTGLDHRTVERATKAIQAKGFVKLIKPGGGAGRANIFRLQNPGVRAGDTSVQNPGAETEVRTSKTPVAPSQNPGGTVPKPRRGDRANRTEQREQRKKSSKNCADAGARHDAAPHGDGGSFLLNRLQATDYGDVVTRIRLVNDHPAEIAAILDDLDARREKGEKITNPGGWVHHQLQQAGIVEAKKLPPPPRTQQEIVAELKSLKAKEVLQ